MISRVFHVVTTHGIKVTNRFLQGIHHQQLRHLQSEYRLLHLVATLQRGLWFVNLIVIILHEVLQCRKSLRRQHI